MALKKPGQLVLFRFPQTDLLPGKLRPALLLARLPSERSDWLVCMVSSQISKAAAGVDEVVNSEDEDFSVSGLKGPSVIRLTRLAVVDDSLLIGAIGEISTSRLMILKRRLAKWIENS